jgi:hypothetical protein
MSTEFELFPGKNLSGLFQDIYNNQLNKKQKISELIVELKKLIKHSGDVALIGPIIKDLIDTSVRNDEQLIKMAQIAQRIMNSVKRVDEGGAFLSEEEKQQLLKDLEEIQYESGKTDDVEEIVNNVNTKK